MSEEKKNYVYNCLHYEMSCRAIFELFSMISMNGNDLERLFIVYAFTKHFEKTKHLTLGM